MCNPGGRRLCEGGCGNSLMAAGRFLRRDVSEKKCIWRVRIYNGYQDGEPIYVGTLVCRSFEQPLAAAYELIVTQEPGEPRSKLPAP